MMLNRSRLAGMGALVDDQVNAILLSFEAGLAFEAERGTIPDPSVVRESMLSETSNTCSVSFNPQIDCPTGVPTAAIDAAVATYTSKVNDAKATAAAYFANSPIAAPAAVSAPAPQVYTAAIAPQTSAAPQATALIPSQILPASPAIATAPAPAPASTDYLATAKAWLGASTYGFPNLVLVLAALGVGFYFYSKRGAR